LSNEVDGSYLTVLSVSAVRASARSAGATWPWLSRYSTLLSGYSTPNIYSVNLIKIPGVN